jgi:hypothetical protein
MTDRIDGSAGPLDRLVSRLSRRTLMTSGTLLGAGAIVGRVDLLRSAAQESVTVADAVNAAITLEAFAVTFYGAALGWGDDIGFNDETATFARAAQCEEEAHYHFFESAGAVPETTSFTVPEDQLANQGSFLNALLEVESILVGAHMAATRQYAANGDYHLVEIGYQIGAVEAQHQAVTRQLLGERLPADRAFARWLFEAPAEAVAVLEEMDYIGSDGTPFNFPGPVDRQCRGVTGLVPETTEDKPPEELPPAASPQPEVRA